LKPPTAALAAAEKAVAAYQAQPRVQMATLIVGTTLDFHDILDEFPS
jgi:hypothetical protein